jgi:hypothetical protein
VKAAGRIADIGRRLVLATLLAVAMAACGSDSDSDPDVDAGADADADADTSPDVGIDEGSDVVPDDVDGTDIGADADADVGADVAPDADVAPGLLPPLDGAAAEALATVAQLVVVVTAAWREPGARLALFVRGGEGWEPVLGPWPAEVGRTGLSWGRGLTQPPPGATNVKVEGDGSAPAGIFRLGAVMGYAAEPPPGLALPYRPSSAQTICVDDPASVHYNKLIEASDFSRDWSSWENMRRSDELYSLLAPIDHNGLLEGGTPVPGGGSCIFLHLWSGPGIPTIGCTALDGGDLLELLLALSALDDVLLVQLPRAEYDAAVILWGLPALTE